MKYLAYVQKNCVACGACQSVCPRKAIAVDRGTRAIVNSELCVGCGICIKTCPAGIIKKIERGAQ